MPFFRGHNPALEKTVLCHHHPCQRGTDDCWFAHGDEELRCRIYAETRSCPLKDMGRCSKKHTFITERIVEASEFNLAFDSTRQSDAERLLADESNWNSHGMRPRGELPKYRRLLPGFPPPEQLEKLRATKKNDVVDKDLRMKLEKAANAYLDVGLKQRSSAINDVMSPIFSSSDLEGLLFNNPSSGTSSFFHCLLHVEDVQNTNDMRLYDLRGHTLSVVNNSSKVQIQVPGLAEKRPSVIRGDTLLAVDQQDKVHAGYVHFVNVDNVHVDFDREVCQKIYHREDKFDVVFLMSRTQIRAMHRAIEECDFQLNKLPSGPQEKAVNSASSTWSHGHDTLNDDQTAFVDAVLSANTELNNCSSSSSSPNAFLCWGPPGTGKTTTIVATIAALLENKKSNGTMTILACAPSNEAAMVITERLAADGKKRRAEVIHLHANCRDPKQVRDQFPTVYECSKSFISPDGSFCLPTGEGLNELASNSQGLPLVVICTLSTAAKLYGLFDSKVSWVGFDYIFVDEAGQALYPQLLQALCLAHSTKKQKSSVVCLSGDHKQLGPQIRSRAATKFGLDKSALTYWVDLGSQYFQEKVNYFMLRENYRSHSQILEMFNHVYDEKLIPKAPQHNEPGDHVHVYHVEGSEEQEADSPSWMNREEIKQVFRILEELMTSNVDLTKDLVILTPYIKQGKKIQGYLHELLMYPGRFVVTFSKVISQQFVDAFCNRYSSSYDGKNYPIKVCTVEAFQGREAKIVILSTVRSHGKSEQIQLDISRQLGFLRQPRRANVALSRAKNHLYIVGNLNLLCSDDFWRRVFVEQMALKQIHHVDSHKPFVVPPKQGKKAGEVPPEVQAANHTLASTGVDHTNILKPEIQTAIAKQLSQLPDGAHEKQAMEAAVQVLTQYASPQRQMCTMPVTGATTMATQANYQKINLEFFSSEDAENAVKNDAEEDLPWLSRD